LSENDILGVTAAVLLFCLDIGYYYTREVATHKSETR
jgi:hypothetical protein